MFSHQTPAHLQAQIIRTSKLWFLGFGVKLIFTSQQFSLKKGHKQVSVPYSLFLYATVERRFFRGTTLVVHAHNMKTTRFRMTKRQAVKVSHLINANANHLSQPE